MSNANDTTYTVHVTEITNGSAYGHATSRCDAGGCAAGTDHFFEHIGDVEVGGVYELDEAGVATREVRQ